MVVQTLTDAEMREIMNRVSNFYITKEDNVRTPFMDKFKAEEFTDKDYKFLLHYSVLLERGNPQTRGQILENILRKRRIAMNTNEKTNRTPSQKSKASQRSKSSQRSNSSSARKSSRGRSRNGRGSQRSRSSARKSRSRHV